MIPDAEVLAVIVDILKSLDIGAFNIKINNR
jgi:histidyl-tRNA synthetase